LYVIELCIGDADLFGAAYVDVLGLLLGFVKLEEAIRKLDSSPRIHNLNSVLIRFVFKEQNVV
jgi:hypothetical protein